MTWVGNNPHLSFYLLFVSVFKWKDEAGVSKPLYNKFLLLSYHKTSVAGRSYLFLCICEKVSFTNFDSLKKNMFLLFRLKPHKLYNFQHNVNLISLCLMSVPDCEFYYELNARQWLVNFNNVFSGKLLSDQMNWKLWASHTEARLVTHGFCKSFLRRQ